MPGRLPIGRSDTERLLDALLNFEPPEKQEVWLFSTVGKRKGRRSLWGWADMGTGGFGSSDGNRRREKRGRRGTSIPPSFCYVMLCYAMLCYVMDSVVPLARSAKFEFGYIFGLRYPSNFVPLTAR